jgi:hypothetical protein
MRQYLKIVGHEELRRDSESLGIVNTDREALNKYKEEREFRRQLAKVVVEHEQIKNDLGEIKNLLLLLTQQR